MNLLEVRCQKCHVTVGVLPGSVAWHCGQKMMPVDPEEASRYQSRSSRPAPGGDTDAA